MFRTKPSRSAPQRSPATLDGAQAAFGLSGARRWGYGLGAAMNGVNSKVLGAFTLIFYNQVMGLPAQWVTAAITLALIVDALTAPAVGVVSDNLRTRLGRRHPFLFVALALYPLAFVLLWNPPQGLPAAELSLWLTATLIGVRVLDTFYELPYAALLPELVTDYDDRTRLAALRYFVGIVAATLASFLAYQVFMAEGPGGAGGIDERPGWAGFSVTCAVIAAASIASAAFSTTQRIPYLRTPPRRRLQIASFLRDAFTTLATRSFAVTTIFGGLVAMTGGLYFALNLYFQLYFWQLDQGEMALLTLPTIAAAALALLVAPRLGRALGKKRTAMLMAAGSALVCNLPIIGRAAFDIMPANGSQALFAILFVQALLFPCFTAGHNILLTSMIADMVEEAERRTGQRSEGLLNSAETLFKKIISGGGALASGWILAVVAFPKNAGDVGVGDETLRAMGLLYAPISLGFTALAVIAMAFFRLDRSAHEANLLWLRGRGAPAE